MTKNFLNTTNSSKQSPFLSENIAKNIFIPQIQLRGKMFSFHKEIHIRIQSGLLNKSSKLSHYTAST